MTTDPVALVIDIESGLCVNAIVLGPGWSPPDGFKTVPASGDAWIGWTLLPDGTTWIPPETG